MKIPSRKSLLFAVASLGVLGTSLQSAAGAQASRFFAFVVAPDGNEVRYRINEQLARVDLPNDAVGKTRQVYGRLRISSDGRIDSSQSDFVVNAGTLESDRQNRDRYVRTRTLETNRNPTVVFRPKSLRGLPRRLPTSGTHQFEVLGDLTIRGVTRPSTWKVKATARGGNVTGSAVTAFTFTDFEIAKPRVAIVLSVADTIQLEYDFKLIPRK